MIQPPLVTRERANEILIETAKGPMQKCVIAYGGKWYDTRGMPEEDLLLFISELTGISKDDLPGRSMNISI